MTYTQHTLSAAFPSMSAEDFQSLKDSIEANGVLNPITLFEGQVIDGWHRYTAAQSLGLDCPEQQLADWIDPRDYVKAQNDGRRHLTASQRAAAIVSIYKWVPSGANQHSKTGGEATSPPPKTNAELAALAGTTKRTIQQAKAADKAGLIDAVKDGALSAEQAAKVASGKSKKVAKKKAKPADAIPEDLGISDDELIEENTRVQTENNLLNDTIKSLQVSDKDAEIKKLQERVYGLEGRIQQLMASEKSMESKLKYQTEIIHKLRKIYGVETHAEIIAAAQAQAA